MFVCCILSSVLNMSMSNPLPQDWNSISKTRVIRNLLAVSKDYEMEMDTVDPIWQIYTVRVHQCDPISPWWKGEIVRVLEGLKVFYRGPRVVRFCIYSFPVRFDKPKSFSQYCTKLQNYSSLFQLVFWQLFQKELNFDWPLSLKFYKNTSPLPKGRTSLGAVLMTQASKQRFIFNGRLVNILP